MISDGRTTISEHASRYGDPNKSLASCCGEQERTVQSLQSYARFGGERIGGHVDDYVRVRDKPEQNEKKTLVLQRWQCLLGAETEASRRCTRSRSSPSAGTTTAAAFLGLPL